MSKTRNTLLIIISILLIPLTIFWLWNSLSNNSSILENFYHGDLKQVLEATLMPKLAGHEDHDEDKSEFWSKRQPVIEKDHNQVVVSLTEKNFNFFIAKHEYVMVIFYTSRRLAPQYEAVVATLVKDDRVAFAKVDAITEIGLVRKFKISPILGYPMVLLFADGILKSSDGVRTRDDFVRLIRKNTAGVLSIAEKGLTDSNSEELHVIEQPVINQKNGAVVRLTGKNFSSFIAENEYVMVDFYAPWCYWSRKLAPEYEAAAATLLKGDGVALAKVDCTTERELAMKYEISGYPTLLWFVGGVCNQSYYGDRTRDSIVRWIRKRIISTTEKNAEHVFTVSNSQDLNVTRKPVFDEKDEVVVRLTEKNFSSFIAENEYVMVNFYAPWLYWSRILAPEYEAAANLLKGDGVVFAKVDVITDRELVMKYRISGYPTVFLFAGGVGKLYDHNKTRDDIVRWVRKSIAGVPVITEKDDAEHLLAADFIKVVGFYDTSEGKDSKELLVASKPRPDLKFYQTTNPEVAKIFHINSEIQHTVTVQLRAEEESFLTFAGSFTGKELAYFLCGDKGEVPCIKGQFSPVITHYPKREKSSDVEVLDQIYSGKCNYRSEDSIRLIRTRSDAFDPTAFAKVI